MSDTLGVSAFYYIFRDIIRLIHACARVEDIAVIVVVKIAQAFTAQGALLQLYQQQNGHQVTNVIRGLAESYREAGPFQGPAQVLELCTDKKVVVIDPQTPG